METAPCIVKVVAGETLELWVDIDLGTDADAIEVDEEAVRLREELLALAVAAVERPPAGSAPLGTRASSAAAFGTLLVKVGPQLIGVVVRAIADWVARHRTRNVTLTLGADSIELSNVSDDEQRRLLEAFLARHEAGGA